MASALQRFPPTNPTPPEHFDDYYHDDSIYNDHVADDDDDGEGEVLLQEMLQFNFLNL